MSFGDRLSEMFCLFAWFLIGQDQAMCLYIIFSYRWVIQFKSLACWRPPKVLLLCRSWGACVPRRSQRLCQLEFWLLAGTTMLDRLWDRGQTKCNTPLMLATSVFGRILRRPCYVMAQPKSRLDIPWPNDAECMGHVWYHFSCWYPLLFYVESPAGCVGG